MATAYLTTRLPLLLFRGMAEAGLISSNQVEDAMLEVDRAKYCPPEFRGPATPEFSCYHDRPLPLGHGATISAPHMHAQCLELLLSHLLRPGCRILDVGSGSGYLVACMAAIVATNNSPHAAKVIGIDYIHDLVEMARHGLQSDRPDLMEKGFAEIYEGDGYKGYKEHAPYDAIHVGAAAPEIPRALLEQLKEGGRLVIPVGPQHGDQWLMCVDKKPGGEIVQTKLEAVRYVPLVPKKH